MWFSFFSFSYCWDIFTPLYCCLFWAAIYVVKLFKAVFYLQLVPPLVISNIFISYTIFSYFKAHGPRSSSRQHVSYWYVVFLLPNTQNHKDYWLLCPNINIRICFCLKMMAKKERQHEICWKKGMKSMVESTLPTKWRKNRETGTNALPTAALLI